MQHTIFTGLSPNTRARDVRIALSYLCFPWKWLFWRQGARRAQAETMVREYFGSATQAVLFDSGRTALFAALQALEIGEGDEVLVQAFTCIVVINAIRQTGATPVYVDIERETLAMDPADAKKKCSSQTKALIIQHTFGLPADIDKLMALAKEKNLKTIEDCAHSLGATYRGKQTGTFADIGMLSFGGEKTISSVRGGAAITQDETLAERLRTYQVSLPETSRLRIFQHLMHVVLFPLGKALYHLGIGKAMLYAAKKLHLTNAIITPEEKEGKLDPHYPAQYPNALAALLVSQFPHIDEWNRHRKKIAALYRQMLPPGIWEQQHATEEHVYLRFCLFVKNRAALMARLKGMHILLGDWYASVIAPPPKATQNAAFGYIPGSCPIAEERAAHVINLPTDIHIEADAVLHLVHRLTE